MIYFDCSVNLSVKIECFIISKLCSRVKHELPNMSILFHADYTIQILFVTILYLRVL